MIGLLVSVRDRLEAAVALNHGTDVIDMKEPSRGPLGACDAETWNEVCAYVRGRLPVSAALGELAARQSAWQVPQASRIDYVKLGLAGVVTTPAWEDRWAAALGSIPPEIGRVAVAYADHDRAHSPPPSEVLGATIRQGCSALLVDTFDKANGTLFDYLSVETLSNMVRQTRAHQVLIVLAGSINWSTLATAIALQPDYIAVRGAVCRSSRSGRIDGRLIRRFADYIAIANGH